MNTPSFSDLFSVVSGFVKGHTTIISYVCLASIAAFSYFAPAEELYQLKKEFNEYRAEDVAKFELEIVRRKLDDFKKIPEADRPQWVIDSIERLKRQEQRLEDKLDKISS